MDSKSPSTNHTKTTTDQKIFGRAFSFVEQHSIILAPIIYVIGTIIICLRNSLIGLPFVTISIVQYAVLVFYVLIFLAPLILVESAEKRTRAQITSDLKFSAKFKLYWRGVGKIMLEFSLVETIIFSLLFQDVILAVIVVIVTYFVASRLPDFLGKELGHILKYTIQLCMCVVVIMLIPMSLGGMRSFRVTFCQLEPTEEACVEYNYYGEYNGLYQFRDGDTIMLIPTDTGYLQYQKDAINNFKADITDK